MSMNDSDTADLAFGKDEVISRKELKPFTRRCRWSCARNWRSMS
tara:strand:- start:987 stop:1118 length:132 start_codon:yes stop_codon:yes gene_type:complete